MKTLKTNSEGQRLRIVIGDADVYDGEPLYMAIVKAAKREGLAGATVTKGLAGFGSTSRLDRDDPLRLSRDAPVIIEIVDTAERISAFAPQLDKMVVQGLQTIESVHVARYRPKAAAVKGDAETLRPMVTG